MYTLREGGRTELALAWFFCQAHQRSLWVTGSVARPSVSGREYKVADRHQLRDLYLTHTQVQHRHKFMPA